VAEELLETTTKDGEAVLDGFVSPNERRAEVVNTLQTNTSSDPDALKPTTNTYISNGAVGGRTPGTVYDGKRGCRHHHQPTVEKFPEQLVHQFCRIRHSTPREPRVRYRPIAWMTVEVDLDPYEHARLWDFGRRKASVDYLAPEDVHEKVASALIFAAKRRYPFHETVNAPAVVSQKLCNEGLSESVWMLRRRVCQHV
jgi:hypothetical protein